MSQHNRDRKKKQPFRKDANDTRSKYHAVAHVGGRAPLPILSVHDIRRAPPGTTSSIIGDAVPFERRSIEAMLHEEPASSHVLGPVKYLGQVPGMREGLEGWECEPYYGTIQRYDSGFPIGGGEFMWIGITAMDETARHDWRDYQQLKNLIAGREWEAVELYPAESRLRDPSNRFYLWCVPAGVFNFGFIGRAVFDRGQGAASQRPFPPELKPKG